MEALDYVCHIIARCMAVTAVFIIVTGAVKTLCHCVKLETSAISYERKSLRLDRLRSHFGAYLLIGLEFSVASDIILTVLEPTYKSLIILGSIILIRTGIAYFLGRERKEIGAEPPAV